MRTVLAVLAIALGLTACQQDVERAPAERRNLRALDLVPRPAGAAIIKTETSGHTAPDTSGGPIVRWVTRRAFRLAEPETFRSIITRVERDLTRAGWEVPIGSGRYLHARRAARACMPCRSMASRKRTSRSRWRA